VIDLDISVASAAERGILDNLLPLYLHDFSEFAAGTPHGELAPDGRFATTIPIARWWKADGHVPLLLRHHGNLSGFALLNRQSHIGADIDWNMAEYFIVRKYRRSGFGTAAARAIFRLYPGRWEVAVMRANRPALPFWDKVIRGDTGISDVLADEFNDTRWNGAIFRFAIAPA
jgi:predicted acetyltransferase